MQGMYYILRHPSIWKPLRKPIFISLVMSLVITSGMFMFTYLPQAAILTLFNGPFAFIAAIPLVLGESGTLINFLARAFWLSPALDNVFDQVGVSYGREYSIWLMIFTPGSTSARHDVPCRSRTRDTRSREEQKSRQGPFNPHAPIYQRRL